MIYFPDITGRGGWADTLLGILVRYKRVIVSRQISHSVLFLGIRQ
jgi:hypothetical protein